MKKVLIILRHAHRDTFDRSLDNGISIKGAEQVKFMGDFYKKNYGGKKLKALSSPRLRCQETIAAVGEFEVFDLLDERGMNETEKKFEQRIEKFLDWWKSEAPDFLVICSHGDWIPTFFYKAIGKPLDLHKAGLAELVLSGDEIHLKALHQKPGRE